MNGEQGTECLHQLFSSIAKARPESIAITFGDRSLTYRQLDELSNQWVQHFQRLGLKSENLVAVYVDRSIPMIAAMLGVLKVGAAYVPLDPQYPLDRVQTILQDSQASYLLTEAHQIANLSYPKDQTILLNSLPQHQSTLSIPTIDYSINRPAYVIYTSGSTGKPKGVQINQGSMINFLKSMQHTPGLEPGDVVLATTTISFDISVLEIFLPLITGATIRLVDHATSRDAQLLMKEVEQASTVQATPATWRMLLAAGWEGHRGLKILCGGEAMTRDLAMALLSRCDSLWNMYGPTETTVWSSVYHVGQDCAVDKDIVSIGGPIDNTTLHICDDDGNEVSEGEVGELWIGGSGLAHGYWNRADLTAQKFVDSKRGRMYRTGDLVRKGPHQNLFYLGRSDHQVKVRGFRIELGEVEAALAKHSHVSHAAVIATSDSMGDKRLTGYVVLSQSVSVSQIRQDLSQTLPEYMIPSSLHFLDKLPLTPNGKIDRKALPRYQEQAVGGANARVAPGTPTEEKLVSLYGQVLELSSVGVTESFFDLGGHSLSATRLISQIKVQFGKTLCFKQFFSDSSIVKVGALIDSADQCDDALMPIEIRPANERLPLSFAQQRMWYIDQLEGKDTSYNMIEAIRLSGVINSEIVEESFSYLVQRHEILRTTYQSHEGVPYQQVSASTSVPFTVLDYQSLSPSIQQDKLNELAVQEGHYHFDLSKDVLFRVHLIQLAPEEFVLMINMQHIISDDWSMGILYEELGIVYRSLVRNEQPALSILKHQYADYAYSQQQWLVSQRVEEKLAYWRNRLDAVPLTLNLPTDYDRKGTRVSNGANERLQINFHLLNQLDELCRESNMTRFMVLWTAFAILLSRRTQQDDLVIATTMANRTSDQVEKMIGFFINVLPLRVNLKNNPELEHVFSSVREMALEAFQHQDFPLDKIVEKLKFSRGDLDQLPLAQVAFNYQSGQANDIFINDMKAEKLSLDTKIAGTDLALIIAENSDGLMATFEYSTALFKSDTMHELAGQFQQVLEAMVQLKSPNLNDITIAAGIHSFESKDDVQQSYFNSYLNKTNLTGNQLLVWLGQQINPKDPIYNSVLCYQFRESIDIDQFRAAFQQLVNNRDSFRTYIREESGVPRQFVKEEEEAHVLFLDMSAEEDPQRAIEQWIQNRAQTAFALDQSLYCCALLKAADDQFTWCMAQHHIITDGWSQALVYNDMQRIYSSLMNGQICEAIPPISYHEYVESEKDHRQSSRYQKAAQYWQNELSQLPESLRFYGQRPIKQSSLVSRQSRKLGATLTDKIKQFARELYPDAKQSDAASFNIYLALYAIFIASISSQREFTVGIPLHNRRERRFKSVTGLVMQVVPVRICIESGDTVSSLIKRVSRSVRKAMQHGQYVLRNPDQKPLYDVLLNYHMSKGPNFYTQPVDIKWVHPEHAQESISLQVYDFHCLMGDQQANIQIDLDFHRDVFDEEQQKRATTQFCNIVDQCMSRPSVELDSIAVMSQDDVALFDTVVNDTQDEVVSIPLANLIEDQTLKNSRAIAIEDTHVKLTYQDLNAQANQLAHHLIRSGAQRDQPIAVLLNRSQDMIVALLAILKSGACYLPLDPKSPPERIAGILSDAGTHLSAPMIVLSEQQFMSQLPNDMVQRIDIKLDKHLWQDQPITKPLIQVLPTDLAYIIYTSGSTGKPKGVMIEHKAIVNYVQHSIEQYGFTNQDKVLQFSSITFDAAGEEIYPVLAAGGTLVLRDDETIRSPQSFIQKCNHHGITLLSMPTAYFHQLTAAASTSSERFGSQLRMILFGGERVFPQEIERWKDVYGNRPVLVNTYGPTEATVVATTYFLSEQDKDTEIPIGRPVKNASVHIRNELGQWVGVGIPGELCIGGLGLARGYLNRPELTKERFISHPLAKDQLLYRTGDLVCLSPAGQLEFLGRVDDQVKVRGYRIELGEIESTLKDHPSIDECAVLVTERSNSVAGLAAYFSLRGSDTSPKDIRCFLQERLPEYMIPSEFSHVTRFPTTIQGKIDRRALPGMGEQVSTTHQNYVAPENAVEEKLVAIWQEVLGVNKIGVTDDFFDLGGHSLIATQIVSRIQQAFHIELSLRELFQDTTIRTLSLHLKHHSPSAPKSAPAIARISRDKHRISVNTQGDLMEASS